MKKMLLALSLALIGSAAVAAPQAVTVVEISATGDGHPFVNNPALIADGVAPAGGSDWNGEGTVSWSGTGKWITLTFDQVYQLDELVLYADNRDSFIVELSLDNVIWTAPIVIPSSSTEAFHVEARSAKRGGKVEHVAEFDARSLSFSDIAAEPVLALYARIRADGGDKGGKYAVGELSFFGERVLATAVTGEAGAGVGEANPAQAQEVGPSEAVNQVPEPGSLALLATGLLGAGLGLRRRRT